MVAQRKQVQIFGKVLEKRFEAKQTRHMKFSAEVAQVLKILSRAINIAVRNDETTLEVHTKVVEEALEIMKLTSANKCRIRYVSRGLKNKRCRSRTPRSPRQRSRFRIAAW